jgi:hypothetical protein
MPASYGFRRPFGLWSGLSLLFTSPPLSLYTFRFFNRLGSGLPCVFRRLGFPEFDGFYQNAVLEQQISNPFFETVFFNLGFRRLSPLL